MYWGDHFHRIIKVYVVIWLIVPEGWKNEKFMINLSLSNKRSYIDGKQLKKHSEPALGLYLKFHDNGLYKLEQRNVPKDFSN